MDISEQKTETHVRGMKLEVISMMIRMFFKFKWAWLICNNYVGVFESFTAKLLEITSLYHVSMLYMACIFILYIEFDNYIKFKT